MFHSFRHATSLGLPGNYVWEVRQRPHRSLHVGQVDLALFDHGVADRERARLALVQIVKPLRPIVGLGIMRGFLCTL